MYPLNCDVYFSFKSDDPSACWVLVIKTTHGDVDLHLFSGEWKILYEEFGCTQNEVS